MPYEPKRGDRVLTPMGLGTVVGPISMKVTTVGPAYPDPVTVFERDFAVRVIVDGAPDNPHLYVKEYLEPTVTTEIIHELRSERR